MSPPNIPASLMDPFEAQPHLKEWGSPATDDEVYEITDLDEFISTNFDDMFRSREPQLQSLGPGASDIQTQPSPSKSPRLDTRHLYRLVPQVCFLPTMLCQPIAEYFSAAPPPIPVSTYNCFSADSTFCQRETHTYTSLYSPRSRSTSVRTPCLDHPHPWQPSMG